MHSERDVDALLSENDGLSDMDVNRTEISSANSLLRSNKRSHLPGWTRSPLWFFCSMTLIVLSLLPMLNIFPNATEFFADRKSSSIGHSTEFANVQPAISQIETRFKGALIDDENGDLHFDWSDTESAYSFSSGASWEDIDHSWQKLLGGRYVRLLPEEVDELNRDSATHELTPISSGNTTEGYFGGPDMLHSLHCLNNLRQALYPDRYKNHMWMDEALQRLHNDHCIEQLRQAILCHGDMTPVTIKPVKKDGEVWAWLGETQRLHTCRDGMKLREWWWRRAGKTGSIIA